MSFITPCSFCEKKFLSTGTLVKHCSDRHGKSPSTTIHSRRFFDSNSKEIQLPIGDRIPARSIQMKHYLDWLSCLAERINGSHHPKFQGIEYLFISVLNKIKRMLIFLLTAYRTLVSS